MPPSPLLNRDQLTARLPGWTVSDDGTAITRRFRFADFSTAWAFMTRAALAAERADHHPDWSNSYGTVDVSLSTHDAGGVTEKDVALAGKMDGFAGV